MIVKRKKCHKCSSKLKNNGLHHRGATVELHFQCQNPKCPVQHIISEGKDRATATRSLNEMLSAGGAT